MRRTLQSIRYSFEDPRDRAEYRRPAHRPGVEIVEGRFVRLAFEAHTHQAFGLGIVHEGVERFRYRGADHLAAPGSIILMNPDELHAGRAECPQGWGYRMLYLEPGTLEEIVDEAGWSFGDVLVEGDLSTARLLGAQLQALWQSQDALELDGLLLQFLETLRPHARCRPARKEAAPGRFAQVIDYMQAHMDEAIQLDDLAAVAGLSRFHFLRQFRACHHVTPHKMLMALRLHAAKGWLAQGTPPAEVALRAGLTDQAHLTRAFTQRYGVSPARYRRQADR